MYGLLEAAEQIRTHGRLMPTQGAPATAMRGIRYFLHNQDLEEQWYYSPDYWSRYFAMLARNRFNRFNLVFAHQTNYLAPPYPFWLAIEEFPEIRVPGLTPGQRERNLAMLRHISQAAADHGIDFTLGVWEHNVQTTPHKMTPTVEGITPRNIGPYSRAALKKLLELCPAIRSVQMRTNAESGIPNEQQTEFYGKYIFPVIRDAGRVLDLRAWGLAGGMIQTAREAGARLRVSTKYWAEDLGRPYQPAETWPGYSYMSFLEQPRDYQFYWEIWGLGSHRLLLWGDPEYVQRAASTFGLGGGVGFEIDPPLAQKGFDNRPGRWGIFTEAQKHRAFWQYEFERYWFFYLLWGRLSYDPKTPDAVWLTALKERFGAAAGDMLEAYRQSSRVINEIVAVHLADPNMYIWPEINPGGMIDSYIEVRPSDWRFVASVPEAVNNRLRGMASAKQTPHQTARLLNGYALGAEQALERAEKKLPTNNKEWASTVPDFRVLAALARYHALRQTAAVQIEWFDRTGDLDALQSAKRDLTAALAVWEGLVKLTDGLYPSDMAFGPDDVGHWKDKLPYVRHDLERVRERLETAERFGKFDFAFDFEPSPAPAGRGGGYRNTPFVLGSTVEPRFRIVGPDTQYDRDRGYGWAAGGRREAVGIAPTPYLEIRGVSRNPTNLTRDVLYRDYIRGDGAQQFRVTAGPGDFEVLLLHPDRTVTSERLRAEGEHLTISFPAQTWSVSGLVIKGLKPAPASSVRLVPGSLSRPAIVHLPPANAQAGKSLTLHLQISPLEHITSVRLHYRSVNQLAKFQVLEGDARQQSFTIPAEDISPKWDLLYYFEVLNKEGDGWFVPDPRITTPYYVVKVEP